MASDALGAVSGDASITRQEFRWTLGTSVMERVVALEDGKLHLKSVKNRTSGFELMPPGSESDEFFVSVGEEAERWSGARGGWEFVGEQQQTLKQGELQLDLTLRNGPIAVTKSYVIYPGSSIVREWVTFRNASDHPIRLSDPGFLSVCTKNGDLSSLDFLWMSGGDNQPGSWKLKQEALAPGKARAFDSYEPFPVDPDAQFPGDGVNARILLNDQPLWPKSGWLYSANSFVRVPLDVNAEVAAGDKLVFQVNMNKNYGNDTTEYNPTITYEGGEVHTASKEFGAEQGKSGWRYQYLLEGKYVDMVFDATAAKWRRQGSTDTPWISADSQHPDPGQDVVRVWTAPKAGRVRLAASVCNTGNGGGSSQYGFRPGTGTYAPWYALYNRATKEGLFIGWDYFGHWTSSFKPGKEGAVNVELKVAGHKQELAPGASITTPKAFVGLYRDDLDNAGNECLDWQYRYLWDYTREGWFPAIRMQGFWPKGTSWGSTWAGGGADFESTFRKIFRVADLMSYCGADVYHRDWGWWDRAGDWNGPDFRTTNLYLRKHGMGQLIYAFLYTVDPASQVARQHPEWLCSDRTTLDMSRPEVVEFMKGQLDGFVERWGTLEWRNDSFFTCPNQNREDTPMLGQDQGFRKVIQDFLDHHPDCAFQSVNGGGNYGGYDYTRFSSSFSFSDGAVGVLRNYYAALLFPPDKTSDIPEVSPPYDYDPATWRGKLCINFDMYGDTWDPAKLEGVRQLVDIYHYLQSKEVVGRWVKVYRPTITGDDPIFYFERLSGDRQRGIIIPKHTAPKPVTIRPKGLLENGTYEICFHESNSTEKRSGADLMKTGIRIEKMAPGELIYLNLPLHPGSKRDSEPPSPPAAVTKRTGDNMGFPGLELAWQPGKDNNWISYYEVFRDGVSLDKVAKGTFYFDHSVGADPAARYEVRTVDGAGNVSPNTAATGPEVKRSTVLDDAPGGGITFTGDWQRLTQLQPAHSGSISSAKEKGATATLAVPGRKLLWIAKLGDDCGKAEVRVDDGPPEVVDTYSADDIWGVCVFRKELADAGPHTLKITLLGEHSARSKGNQVYLDGVRGEP